MRMSSIAQNNIEVYRIEQKLSYKLCKVHKCERILTEVSPRHICYARER